MKKRLLCVVIKDNHIYYVNNDSIFKQDKNCYIITKYGSMSHPFIGYDEKSNGKIIEKNMYIGGYYELVEFLKCRFDKRVYLRGFNRAILGKIFRLVLEDKSSEVVDEEFTSVKKNNAKVRAKKNSFI